MIVIVEENVQQYAIMPKLCPFDNNNDVTLVANIMLNKVSNSNNAHSK